MRVAVLSLPLRTNYGGILQSYALKVVLENLGHNVKIIDYDVTCDLNRPWWAMLYYYSKRIIMNLIGIPTPILWEKKIKQENRKIKQHTDRFINDHLPRIVIKDFKQIGEHEFDVFIAGSDQVWRPKYFESMFHTSISRAYFDFAKTWPSMKFAYAASFGVDVWEYSNHQTRICRELIKQFTAISVREDSAVHLCEKNLNVKVEHVLDPTMLLKKEDYLSLIVGHPLTEKKEIMLYILDDNEFKQEITQAIISQTGYDVYSCRPISNNTYSDVIDKVIPSVEDWIDGFNKSKVIITDSFHACVFAIIFHKPFVAIVNTERGAARFKSLLKLFGLENHIVKTVDDIAGSLLTDPLPDLVKVRLEELRLNSLNFLKLLNNADNT